MSINPAHLSVGRLFGDQFIFQVPKYQRSYAWTAPELEDFLNDIVKCYTARSNASQIHHFFGGIMSVTGTFPGSTRRHAELVDGQQRLATIILFVTNIARIYDELALTPEAAAAPASKQLLEERSKRIRQRFIEYEDEINRTTVTIERLTLSGPDKQYFKDLISGQHATESRDSHRRISLANKMIRDRILSISNSLLTLTEKIDALKTFEDVIHVDCTVIHIPTDTKEEAYRLFQVLNDRGTSLTEGDLLRAATLELLDPPAFAQQQAAAEAVWDDILRDDPKQTEDYLRWIYSSFQGKRPGTASLFDDLMNAFFPQVRNATRTVADATNILKTLKNLQSEVDRCRKLNAGEWPYRFAQPITQWDRDRLTLLIRELGHTTAIPLLLAACHLAHDKFAEVVHSVERFYFRYKVVCNLHPGSFNRIYLDQAKVIRTSPASYSVNTLRAELLRLQTDKASDATFTSMLVQMSYDPDNPNKILKYFLMTLEHYLAWYRAGARGNPACMDKTRLFDFANTTIEHVYPQNAPAAAVNAQLEPLKHGLGNLSFWGPRDNNAAGNNDFATKKPILSGSSVLFNREIAGKAQWTKTEVESRRDEMLAIAAKVFVP